MISTGNGRAEVEFENGSLALIGENTVLQFFDLSLEDGAKTTRLILRQGTASFSVNPSNGDYFSVTGGDFSVEADGHSASASTILTTAAASTSCKGRINVLRKKGSTLLDKGPDLLHEGRRSKEFRRRDEHFRAATILTIGSANRISAEYNDTAAAQQYVNSPNYSSGLSQPLHLRRFLSVPIGELLAPLWCRSQLVTVRQRPVVHRSFHRHVFHRQSALGLAAVSLWWLGV